MPFLNSWRVNCHVPMYGSNLLVIQKWQQYSRETQIELPLFECEYELPFRIRASLLFSLALATYCLPHSFLQVLAPLSLVVEEILRFSFFGYHYNNI